MFKFQKKNKGRIEGIAKVTGQGKYSAEYQSQALIDLAKKLKTKISNLIQIIL